MAKPQLPDDPEENGATVSDDEIADDEAFIDQIRDALGNDGLG
jgi:hypothetical protein